jgi:LysM repeat protein
VKVVQGDTLEALAARYGVSVQDLMRLNTISRPEELQIGQSLKLPPSKGLVQVRTGDTLAVLAARHRTTAAELQKMNPGVKPDQLKVGAWLKLPAAPAGAKATPTASATAKPAPKPTATVAPKPTVTPKPPAPASPPAVKAPAPSAPPSPGPPQPGEAVRWRFYGNTLVDWGGWKLHSGGVRVSLVQPTPAEVGPIRAQATAVAVHCSSLRQAWLINGAWGPWVVPEGRSVAQQIVLAAQPHRGPRRHLHVVAAHPRDHQSGAGGQGLTRDQMVQCQCGKPGGAGAGCRGCDDDHRPVAGGDR